MTSYKGFYIVKKCRQIEVTPIDNSSHKYFFGSYEEAINAIDLAVENGMNLSYFE